MKKGFLVLMLMLFMAFAMTSCVTFDVKMKDNLCMQFDVVSLDGTAKGAVEVCGSESLKQKIADVIGKATAYIVTPLGKSCMKGECPPLPNEPTSADTAPID
jgi:hypothetical protein